MKRDTKPAGTKSAGTGKEEKHSRSGAEKGNRGPDADKFRNGRSFADLRRRAEEYPITHPERSIELSGEEIQEFTRELGTYHIALEIQNEELQRVQAELEKSRRRFADLYDFAPVGYFSLDHRGTITSVNRTGAVMLAANKNELAGLPFALLIPEKERDAFYLYTRRILDSQGKEVAEFKVEKNDGTCMPVQLESIPITDDGVIVEIRTAMIDISERVSAERRLQEKSSLLRTIIDTTEVMLVCLDRDFNFTWVNPAYAETCGMTPEEMAGKNHFELYPNPENEEIFRRVRDSGKAVFFKDKPFAFPDQPERGITYWDWGLNPVKDDSGRVAALVFSLRETTEHKQAQLDLVKSEERFRLMAETSADIIFQTDPSGILDYVSPAISRLGYEPFGVVGRSFTEFLPPGEMDRGLEALRKVNRGEQISLLELQVLNADQNPVYFEISATPIVKDGIVSGVQGMARDISERKEAEQRLKAQRSLLAGINTIFEAGLGCETEEELALAALRVAEEITGSSIGFISEINADSNLRDLANSESGRDVFTMHDQTGHGKADFSIAELTGRVMTAGEAFFANDLSSDQAGAAIPPAHPPIMSFLGAPLIYNGKTTGIIALANRKEGYGEAELSAVKTLAPVFMETLFKHRTEKALEESQTRANTHASQLKQFLDFIPNPVWIAHDPECKFITGNLAAAELLGIDPDLNISRSAPPDVEVPELKVFKGDRELAPEEMPLQCAVRLRKPVDDAEIDLVLPEGKVVQMLGAATPLFDDAGNVTGGISAFMDITERKWMEEQLVKAKLEWEKTFDAVPDLIAVLDPNHRILRANRAMAAKMGLVPEMCVGRHCFTCVHGEKHPVENCPNTRTLRDGKEHMEEVHEERLGGDFLVTTTPLFDEQGDVIATVHVARDITRIKESERLIRESERRLNRAQKIAHLGSWELDHISNVLTWSDEVYRIFGIEPQTFVPSYEGFIELVHPAEKRSVEVFFADSLQSACDSFEIEHRILRKDSGETRYILERFEHLRDECGNVIRSSGMVQDITERRHAEEEITVLNKRLQYSFQELSLTNRELERSNRDLQQFAYIISHDLQEPLRTVSSFLQLLSRRYDDALDDKARTFIDYAVGGADHMQKLLQDLLQFSRVGGGEPRLQVLSLQNVLEQTLLQMQQSISENRAEIICTGLPRVLGDEILLSHVMQNLIGNGVKFRGTENPRIHISAERTGDKWTVCVRDNGIGIDPRYAERIFLIFQRLHRRTEIAGTGIGLAICKRVIELHGGQIWVESVPGEGAAFYFTLPAAEDD